MKPLTLRPSTVTLFVVSIMFDGDAISFPALFELRAAGWSVEIEHSAALPDWGIEAAVWFNARKELPDNSPGISPNDKLLQNDVWKEIEAFSKKWDGFVDHMDCFKNPKATRGRICPTTPTSGKITTEPNSKFTRAAHSKKRRQAQ
jgi:hypothetical protein